MKILHGLCVLLSRDNIVKEKTKAMFYCYILNNYFHLIDIFNLDIVSHYSNYMFTHTYAYNTYNNKTEALDYLLNSLGKDDVIG